MNDVLLDGLKRIVEKFPDADFRVMYFDNDTFEIKEVTDEDFRSED